VSGYLLRRVLQIVPTLLLITLLVFGLLQVTGGDPIAIMLGPSATTELVEQVRHELGLDRPAWVRYPVWLWRVAQGDLGKSIRTRRPVTDMILARVPVTLTLAASATLFSVLVGVSAGVYAATRRGRPGSYLVGVAALVGGSVRWKCARRECRAARSIVSMTRLAGARAGAPSRSSPPSACGAW